ncbi:dGTPase [Orbus hercynius]|uniref:Probable deoxyguanosinetriphosphate triphosphohydrolase n=1 Tax=Orbus hercynius TaxID=593135 RepID=A0A495RHY2_9GAMM|nr:dGTPase [Orbus hercynius]RKS87031.1 dGTPase [Orbus hercynius]
MIDFKSKISYQRHVGGQKECEANEYALIRRFESDRGRILNSAAIRRLQQKTQVFPLERNSVVRTRLTHSLEVQQVGRYIVKEIYQRLEMSHQLKQYGLDKLSVVIESLVEMACLMHDIGNPPFGHFGEAAINHWFTNRLGVDKQQTDYTLLNYQPTDSAALNELRKKVRQDLCHFEGNAQAIRLVHTILKLNLTYSQIACILKYTKPAYWTQALPAQFDYLMKKPGFYLAEEPFVKELLSSLGQQEYHRYPLTYIMEAADDISYCIADLEDAVEKRIFTVEQLYDYLHEEWGPIKEGDLFDVVVKRAYSSLKHSAYYPIGVDQFFMYLRVNTIGKLVPHAAERFIENIDAIYEGSFNHALLEDHDAEFKLLDIFKNVGFKHVFNHESVENIELQGYRIINGLLDIYCPLLAMPAHDFLELVEKGRHKHYMIETRLFHKLSAKHCIAYEQAIEQLDRQAEGFLVWEFYYRSRLIQDYISGMTDHFAYDEYRQLMVTD